MRNLSTGVFLGLLWLGLSVSIAAGAEGVDFRKDVFLRGTDGYHTCRIPTMVVTDKETNFLKGFGSSPVRMRKPVSARNK